MLRHLCLAALLSASLAARADEPAIIAKARAYIGSEAALAGLRSLHYVGKITTLDPDDPKKSASATMDIIFQSPWQHRLLIKTPQIIETRALDDFEAWQRIQDAANPARAKVGVLPLDQVRGMRADVWENLGYFRGIETEGGRIEDQGSATIDGIACEKIAFIHSPTLIFYRYFDPTNGRLVYTETASGVQIRTSGEIVVDGLRFPTSLVQKHKPAGGKEQVTNFQFDKITVNESFPESFFAVPPPELPVSIPRARAPAAPAPLPAAPPPPPISETPSAPAAPPSTALP